MDGAIVVVREVSPASEAIMATASTIENFGHIQHARIGARLLGALVAAEAWIERHRQRRSLLALDDRMLRDIGLSHADVASEASKHFWEH
jgi:uncharacterized protein YjiS (DUF1127 family)